MEKQHDPKFYLFLKKSQTNSRQEAKLFVRISDAGRRPMEITTQLSVPIKLWDQRNQQVLQPTKNRELQQQVSRALQNILEAHEQLSAEDFYSQKKLADFLYGKKLPATRITYKFLYQKHLEIYGDDIAPGTWKNYRSTNLRFLEFIRKEHQLSDLDISGFSRPLIIEFIAWLKQRKPDEGFLKCSHTTAQKHVERIVRLLSFAVEMQYIPFHPITGLRKKHVLKSRTCLDQSEIDSLITCELPERILAEIRDVFLFSCYTGLSYGDIHSLSNDDLIKDINGNLAISKIREKTHRSRQIEFFVPLLPMALQILDQYKDSHYCRVHQVLLPVRQNQYYNRLLKKVALHAGIDKKLTTHVARHTFATTITQDNGISLEAISEMLGHTQIRTTQIYSKTTVKRIMNEMSELKLKFLEDSQKESGSMG